MRGLHCYGVSRVDRRRVDLFAVAHRDPPFVSSVSDSYHTARELKTSNDNLRFLFAAVESDDEILIGTT